MTAVSIKIAVLTRRTVPFGERIRIDGIVDGLRRQGHDVEVLAMDYRLALSSPSLALVAFCLRNVAVLTRQFGPPTSRTMLKIWLDCVINAYFLIPALRRGKFEILLTETHHAGLCGWLIRRHIGCRHYMDFHGTADEASDRPALFRQALRLEGALVRESDFVISCSGIMRSLLLSRHGGAPDRHVVCHNGAVARETVAQFGLPLRVIYAGVFAYYQRVMDFVDAARLNTDPEIEFYLMGGGGNEAEVLKYIKRNDIKINWLGYRPREEALATFAAMQVGVLPTTDDVARQVASPIKILDYASCGLPVVTVAVGEWSDVFDEYRAGVVCTRCEPALLLAGIRSLKDEGRWTQASHNAIKVIREVRSWDTVLAPLYRHLRSPELEHPPVPVSEVQTNRDPPGFVNKLKHP